jgi:hypothetical protein
MHVRLVQSVLTVRAAPCFGIGVPFPQSARVSQENRFVAFATKSVPLDRFSIHSALLILVARFEQHLILFA